MLAQVYSVIPTHRTCIVSYYHVVLVYLRDLYMACTVAIECHWYETFTYNQKITVPFACDLRVKHFVCYNYCYWQSFERIILALVMIHKKPIHQLSMSIVVHGRSLRVINVWEAVSQCVCWYTRYNYAVTCVHACTVHVIGVYTTRGQEQKVHHIISSFWWHDDNLWAPTKVNVHYNHIHLKQV